MNYKLTAYTLILFNRMKLGMTGNRDGMTKTARDTLVKFLDDNIIKQVHHGDCKGADQIFNDICASRKIKIIIHPPNCDTFRAFCKADIILSPKKYIERNHNIVDDTDMLIAFPSSEKEILRSGTWATIRYAKKIKKPILIIYPNGTSDNI